MGIAAKTAPQNTVPVPSTVALSQVRTRVVWEGKPVFILVVSQSV